MTTLLEAVFLGLVQGLAEWLPISSSGHLVILQQMMGIKASLFFDVMLHLGTLLAVLAFFWKDILKILKSISKLDFRSESGRFIPHIIVGTIPVALFGYFLYDFFEMLFSSLYIVGLALLVTGSMLYLTKFKQGRRKVNLFESVLIGIAQTFALIPGISRSGTTISAGLFRGLDRTEAFKFSFLLSIPAVLGANLFELTRVATYGIDVAIVLGTAISAFIGYVSLKFLFKTLKKGKFYLFSFYCWVVGAIVLIFAVLF